jgi:hypothetical protein
MREHRPSGHHKGEMNMTINWMKTALAAVLLGTMVLSACTTPSSTNAGTGLYDRSSDNTESVPYEAWFKDRPQ